MREGDSGDRFYIVAEGDGGGVRVRQADLRARRRRLLRRDRAHPRPAAHGDGHREDAVVLYALDREDFLAAVTSHAPSAEAAEEVVSARLAGIPVGGARPVA